MALTGAKRFVGALSALAVVGGSAALASPASDRAPARVAGVTSHETGIHFTSKTVAIPKATVKANLIGVSADGTFKFKHAAGALAKLKTGSVMLLEGSDAVVVTKITHSHGQLLVRTKSASLPQLISAGKISFSGAPNLRNVFAAPVLTSSRFKAAGDLEQPGYPYLGAHAAGVSFSVQGSSASAPFGYSLTFTPTPTRIDVEGVICFQWGSICSNGPSNGLSLEVHIVGYIQTGSDTAAISFNGGRITNSSFGVHDMKAHLKLTYTGARGDGPDSGGDPPTFHLPIGIDYTIPGEIPIYLKLQTGLYLRMGLSSKNTVIRGGVDYNTSGSETITQSGKSESGTGSGSNPHGQFLDHTDGGTGTTIGLGTGGVVAAVQFPKIGVGLGVRALNGIGYLDMITSVGQSYAGAIAGGGCKYDFYWSIGGGFEAQLGPFGIASARKILIPTSGDQYHASTSAPGC